MDGAGEVQKEKKCSRCGRVLPITEFRWHKDKRWKVGGSYSGMCIECERADGRACRIGKKYFGIPPDLIKMTEDEVIGNLYDSDRSVEYTADDLGEELSSIVGKFMWSIQNCLDIHRELLEEKESRDKALGSLSLLQQEIQKWKGDA